MTRRLTRRSTVAAGQGLLGLALGLPLMAGSVQAQEAASQDPAAQEPTVEVEQVELEQVEVEAPRVLISEVLIEGIAGHPEEERLQMSAYEAMQVRPGTREELQRDLNAIQATAGSPTCGSTPSMVPCAGDRAGAAVPHARGWNWIRCSRNCWTP